MTIEIVRGRAGRMAGMLLVPALLAGCMNSGSGGRAISTPPASPRQHPMLTNIPIPMGFRLVPERSVVRESGQIRAAICEFEGRGSAESLTAFYQNHMPSANFQLRTSGLVNGEYTMRFESDREECTISVKESRGATRVVIDLGPLPRGEAERENPPARRR